MLEAKPLDCRSLDLIVFSLPSQTLNTSQDPTLITMTLLPCNTGVRYRYSKEMYD